MPLDQATQKHRGFAFITYFEKEDAAAAMDNMHNGELYGRVLTVNFAQPQKIKGGEQGWASQAGMECITYMHNLYKTTLPLNSNQLTVPGCDLSEVNEN